MHKKKRNVKSIELKSLASKNLKFDLITLIDVIEHVNNPGLILEYCHKLLEKNGNILIVTPNTDSAVAKILNFKWWHSADGTLYGVDNFIMLFRKESTNSSGAIQIEYIDKLRIFFKMLSISSFLILLLIIIYISRKSKKMYFR